MISVRTTLALATAACAAFGASAVHAQAAPHAPQVSYAVRHDTSPPMRDILANLPPTPASSGPEYVVPNQFLKPRTGYVSEFLDQLSQRNVQRQLLGTPGPLPELAFDALTRATITTGGTPPDTNGDVSPNEYIQWVNTQWAIFNKVTGAKTSGPSPGNSFFAGFGGRCQTTNSGDPLAVWDDRAQRWVMSQFTTGTTAASQCIAVSTTSDPLGTYYRYEFLWPVGVFGDYPHMGVWTDETSKQNGYTLVTHEFGPGSAFLGGAYTIFERDRMLNGLSAKMVRFPGFQEGYGTQPVHLDGTLPATAGACAPFVHFDATTGSYLFWDLCVDWITPANSTISATPDSVSASSPFAGFTGGAPQQSSTFLLDSFGTHIMYHASARAFPPGSPTNLSVVINHSVRATNDQGGIRWVHFALNKPGHRYDHIFTDGHEVAGPASPYVHLTKAIVDEGVYSPDDSARFMGGIAIDKGGNIGVGYNSSSTTFNPRIMVGGRTLSDPPGTLRDEQLCTSATTGAQNFLAGGRPRWGDYAAMNVDPADECAFWFTNEYYITTSTSSNWATRVCKFKFASCGSPDFALTPDAPTRIEVCGTTPGPDPTYGVLAGVVGGFNAPVTLSVVGAPAGTTPSFSINPISPTPGASELTLAGGHGIATGEYGFSISGVSGALTRTLPLTLGISSQASPAPTLTTPANNAVDVKVLPVLTWAATPHALTYTVEVSTSPTFATIFASETVTGTSWAVDATLANTTQYYWRVRASNYCGDGPNSAVFTFTTGTPGVCPAGTTLTNVYQDAFESGVNGWTIGAPGDAGGTAWSQGLAPVGLLGFTLNVWQVPNNAVGSDRSLLSPVIAIPSAGVQSVILSYDAFHRFEDNGTGSCYDGASIEAKVGAGPFTYLAANRMFTDPYNGTATAGAPLSPRNEWCFATNTVNAVHSIVDLDDFAGQSVQLRFRAVSDANTVGTAPNGMVIDNLRVDVCQ